MRNLKLPLHTARLHVREFLAADFAALFALSSDARVTRYMFFGPRDELQTRDYLHDILSAQRQSPRERFELAVESAQSGLIIGACDLTLIERGVADMGYMFAHHAWGQGLATELVLGLIDAAFFDLRAEQVIATVDIANAASIRVLEKTGLRWEAIYRKFRRAKNRWWDCHLYALARTVWESQRSVHIAKS